MPPVAGSRTSPEEMAKKFADGVWRQFGIRSYQHLRDKLCSAHTRHRASPSPEVLARIRETWQRVVTVATGRLPTSKDTDVFKLFALEPEATLQRVCSSEDTVGIDEVTGLRASVFQLVTAAVGNARAKGALFPILALSLDRLPTINEVFGRQVGDDLLRAVAERLGKIVELEGIAYRSANQFILVGRSHRDARHVEADWRSIASMFAEPFRLGTHWHQLGPSIGVAIYPEHGQEPDNLIHRANFARRQARSNGTTTVVCDPAKYEEQRERFQLENELREALVADQLRLYYQPKILMPERRLVGFEALIRWQHPVRGLLGPGVFLDVAEECNLMEAITTWAFSEVGSQTRAWIEAGLTPVPIAINTPPVEFVSHVLTEHLPAYEAYCLPAGLIEIEITESRMIEDMSQVQEVGGILKQRGIKVAMDDFGTGYSCLSGLCTLPLSILKIDQSFTRQLSKNRGSRAIAAAIVSIAKELGFDLVAEGVETPQQLRILLSLGCRIIQGYLTGKPCPPEDAAKLLKPATNRRSRFGRIGGLRPLIKASPCRRHAA